MGDRPVKLIVFADSRLDTSVALLARCVQAAGARRDVTVPAIIETAAVKRPSALRLARRLGSLASAGHTAHAPLRPLLATSSSLGRLHGIPVLAPGPNGVNEASFVEAVRRLAPDAALVLMVSQIFAAPLLQACGAAVNYHPGLLPQYRGIAATQWSVYQRAPVSGFTFHLMTGHVDGGPVLSQGAVPLDERSTASAVEVAKTRRAAAQISTVLRLLDDPYQASVPQQGPSSTFTRADLNRIRTVEDPGALSLDELTHRLRAFERLDMPLHGRWCSVTALRVIAARARNPKLAFKTADGAWVEPARIRHLPPALFRLPYALAARGPGA